MAAECWSLTPSLLFPLSNHGSHLLSIYSALKMVVGGESRQRLPLGPPRGGGSLKVEAGHGTDYCAQYDVGWKSEGQAQTRGKGFPGKAKASSSGKMTLLSA